MNEMNNNILPNQDLREDGEIDLKEKWRIVRSYRKSIIIIFSLIVILTIYITLTTPPVRRATTVVMLKENGADPSSFVFDFGMNKSQQRLKNEIEILYSYNLHEQVINSLISDSSAEALALFGTRYVRKRYRLQDYFLEWIRPAADSASTPDFWDFSKRIRIVEKLRRNTTISTITLAMV